MIDKMWIMEEWRQCQPRGLLILPQMFNDHKFSTLNQRSFFLLRLCLFIYASFLAFVFFFRYNKYLMIKVPRGGKLLCIEQYKTATILCHNKIVVAETIRNLMKLSSFCLLINGRVHWAYLSVSGGWKFFDKHLPTN